MSPKERKQLEIGFVYSWGHEVARLRGLIRTHAYLLEKSQKHWLSVRDVAACMEEAK